ncbi:hypothetical protein MASR2M17_24890 [Aminivibrio sp.]
MQLFPCPYPRWGTLPRHESDPDIGIRQRLEAVRWVLTPPGICAQVKALVGVGPFRSAGKKASMQLIMVSPFAVEMQIIL